MASDFATKEVDVAYSPFMLTLGCALPILGAGIAWYLLRLFAATWKWTGRKTDPDYVRDINRKLRCNRVETERDLL